MDHVVGGIGVHTSSRGEVRFMSAVDGQVGRWWLLLFWDRSSGVVERPLTLYCI